MYVLEVFHECFRLKLLTKKKKTTKQNRTKNKQHKISNRPEKKDKTRAEKVETLVTNSKQTLIVIHMYV